jgi:hypothetical protein
VPNPGRALADRIITYYGDHQPGFGHGIELNNGEQFQQIGVEDILDLNTALLELEAAELLSFAAGVAVRGRDALQQQLRIGNRATMVLTLRGWDRYEQLQRANPQSTCAFMAMQFNDPQMDRIYTDHFQPLVGAIGFDLQTVTPGAGLIDYKIRLQVTASRFVIADLTHENRGVYFEAGYAEGIGRPVIFTCRTDAFNIEIGRPHFDVNHHYCVKWDDPPFADQIEELSTTIRAALLGA